MVHSVYMVLFCNFNYGNITAITVFVHNAKYTYEWVFVDMISTFCESNGYCRCLLSKSPAGVLISDTTSKYAEIDGFSRKLFSKWYKHRVCHKTTCHLHETHESDANVDEFINRNGADCGD